MCDGRRDDSLLTKFKDATEEYEPIHAEGTIEAHLTRGCLRSSLIGF